MNTMADRLRRNATILLAAMASVCGAPGAADAACGNNTFTLSVSQGIELGTFTRPNAAPATITVAADGTRTMPSTVRILSDESIAGRIPHAATVTIAGSATNCPMVVTITSYSTTSLVNATSSLTAVGSTFEGTTGATGSLTFTVGVSQLVNPFALANAIGGTIGISVSKKQGTAATQTTSIPVTSGGLTGVGAVVASLALTATQPTATIPHIVRPSAGNTATLQLTCNSSGAAMLAYGARANPFAGGNASASTVVAASNTSVPGAVSTGTCAHLSVAGQSGYNFSTVVGVSTGVTPGVTVTGNCSSVGSLTVLAGGAAEIYCGANVSVSSTVSTGAYSGSFPVTVTYD